MITKVVTFLASAAKTATFDTETAPIEAGQYKEGSFFLNISAASGTTPTMNAKIVTQDPESAVWHTLLTFAQFTTTGNSRLTVTDNLGTKIALDVTIGGTTPSFTMSVGAVLKAES